MYDIYVITNKVNGKRYVGYTSKGYESRFNDHIKQSRGSSERYLCRAIRKYGKDQFYTELIEQVETLAEAAEREKHFIGKMKTFAHNKDAHGYNATLGGEGMNGAVFSKETRKKISVTHKKRGSWSGESNPKYGKGHLVSGINHPLFGTKMSIDTKEKIGNSNRGRLKGNANPSIKAVICYSLECSTGLIEKFNSFFDLRDSFEKRGIKLNRSSVLAVMRGGKGRKTFKGHMFFRQDVTEHRVLTEIEHKFKHGIIEPVVMKDHRQGSIHPNAKSVSSYAVDVSNGEIHKFDSWFDLKSWFDVRVGSKTSYSNLYNALKGKYRHTRGYKLFREDVTDKDTMDDLLLKYNEGRTFND
ncbi:hypothetical protein C161_11003 [Paenibacillus sp. FSL R5-192]|uniref:GIY-YIG nuclease family protein n=1 Tax=unclassified Paenibacillus TaxID=185978 RepID=UPI0003E2BA9F|nr:GIY-YIG nuclease family protein [Paenibacillus sp. FSL R5-192]ETT37032.1 hypothetical protein C161_11003 [Paenibacillus sp. FSL R5-192]